MFDSNHESGDFTWPQKPICSGIPCMNKDEQEIEVKYFSLSPPLAQKINEVKVERTTERQS
jgi:hypothetical protein